MAMYKLNRFHFHLSDDEGWRLEIPGLPELTEVGGRRCHDLDETSCLIPQLGSGPDADADNGSGFYTRDEYRQILQYAHDRGIEVIPEFDSPGHGHAPIKAMEARGDATYFLHDPEDTSKYTSIQEFRDNAINPCMESTYVFFEKVVQEVKAMHEDIQPLKIFHFGGDETPHGAWEGSPACEGFNIDLDGLKAYFASRLSNITSAHGLDLAGWEDGLMSEGNEPYPRDSFVNDQVYGYAWNNIWEWGGGSRAYVLANNGYKVILSHATDLYFDHPYEPDPEERGFYWATRLTETRNTFNYMPDDVYENIEVDLFGRSITRDEICANPENCVPLEPGSESNIVGMAGQLWAETVRHPEQFNYMVFPRLVALAERAWHRAEWEALSDPDMRKAARDANWAQFAKTLGEKELVRLDAAGVQYRVPPPGARLSGGLLEACSSVPGLTIQYSEDSGESWTDWTAPGVEVTEDVLLRTQSADGNRFSHIVKLDSERTANTDATCTTSSAATCTLSLALLMLVVCFSFVCF
jgi:hexosaminidase